MTQAHKLSQLFPSTYNVVFFDYIENQMIRSITTLSSLAFSSSRISLTSTASKPIPSSVLVSRPSPISVSSKGYTRSYSTKNEETPEPAPGAPFHYAFPVHDLNIAKHFYGEILGCKEGRSSEKWQDYSLYGHQIVAHWVGNDYRCQDYFNPVDGDEVPVPHAGLALTEPQFHQLAKRVEKAGIKFVIEPHLRFKGMPGEQWTMFFKDPSGNNLEFKAMTTIDNLFVKYNVKE